MKYRMAFILPVYAALFVLCYWAAFLLRFEFRFSADVGAVFRETLLPVVIFKMAMCHLLGEWRRSYRYAVFSDVFYVLGSATLSAMGLFAANALGWFGPVPRSIILIDWLLTIPAAGWVRMGARAWSEVIRQHLTRTHSADRKRALVVGTDREAVEIVRASCRGESRYHVVGLVGGNQTAARTRVAGVPVYPRRKGWQKLTAKLSAQLVLIPASVPGREVREIVNESQRGNFRVHVIPSVHELLDGRFKLAARDVTITDLLRREPARLDLERIRQTIEGQRIFVTGAAGSIGSELCRQILKLRPEHLVVFDQSELGIFEKTQQLAEFERAGLSISYVVGDVTQAGMLQKHLEEHAPQTVFHAAAYKHVPLMEQNVREAVRNNVFGTRVLADCAEAAGVQRFVLISTDKAVHPSSVMGATKFLAERYVQVVAARSSMCCITVRFGNVLNSAGSVVPTFRRQIEQGGPVTVTHPEMERFFMTIPEAVQLVLQSAAIGSSGDLLVLEMGPPCRIVDLARDMIALSGLRHPEDIDIVYTGLRPGEKLSEELFYHDEQCTRKVHDKIFWTERPAPSEILLSRQLQQLQQKLTESDEAAARCLWDIVQQQLQQEPQRGEKSENEQPRRRAA